MGGKTKQSQRTKNNARPSSSGRSAELLSSVKLDSGIVNIAGPQLPALFPSLVAPTIDPQISPELQMCLKKLNKKDPITKTKALQELSEVVANSNVDDVVAALSSWAHFYKILTADPDRKVRECTQACHGAVVGACGRRAAPLLRQLAPAWLQAQYDEHAPAHAHARRSLQKTFPDNKLPEVLSFCKDEIVTHFLDILVGNGESAHIRQTDSPEDRELQVSRIVSSSLNGLQYFTRHLPRAHDAWLWGEMGRLLQSAAFWKRAVSTDSRIRAAWFGALAALVSRFKAEFGAAYGAKTLRVLVNARESSPLPAAQLWDCLLTFMNDVQDWHQYLEKKELLVKRILDVLENGGWGDARQLSHMVLPLLAALPPAVLTHGFYAAFFDAIFAGLDNKSILSSKSERQSWLTSLAECLQYLSIQQHDYVLEIVTSVHRTWLEKVLTGTEGQTRNHLIKFSANGMAGLVKYWLKQAKEGNNDKYDQLIRNFWQNVGSTLTSQIDKLPLNHDEISRLMDAHILLLQTLKTSFTQELKKKHSIKFEVDSQIEEEKCSVQSQRCDPSIVERYNHNLDELARSICGRYFEFASEKQISNPVLSPLITLLVEFESEALFSGIARHFNLDSVYAFYENVLRSWLSGDTMRCKAVVDIVFMVMKHLSEEQQDAMFETFKQFPPAVVEWCISLSLSHPHRARAATRRWLRGPLVAGALAAVCARLLAAGDGAAKSLLMMCLTSDADGESIVSDAAVESALQQISASLYDVEAAALEARSGCACVLAATLPPHPPLLTALLALTASLQRGDPRLSLDTWCEVRDAWQDAVTSLDAAQRARFLREAAALLHTRAHLHSNLSNTVPPMAESSAESKEGSPELDMATIEHIVSLCPYLLWTGSDLDIPEAVEFTKTIFDLVPTDPLKVEAFATRHEILANNLSCPYEENDVTKAVINETLAEMSKDDLIAHVNKCLFRSMYLRTVFLNQADDELEENWCNELLHEDYFVSEFSQTVYDYVMISSLHDGYAFWPHHKLIEQSKDRLCALLEDVLKEISIESKRNILNCLSELAATRGFFWSYARRYFEVQAKLDVSSQKETETRIDSANSRVEAESDQIEVESSQTEEESSQTEVESSQTEVESVKIEAESIQIETETGQIKETDVSSNEPAAELDGVADNEVEDNVNDVKEESLIAIKDWSSIVTGSGFFHTLQANTRKCPENSETLRTKLYVSVRALWAAHAGERGVEAALAAGTGAGAGGCCDPDLIVNTYYAHNHTMLYEMDISNAPWAQIVSNSSICAYLKDQVITQGWTAQAHQWDFTNITLCSLLTSVELSKNCWGTTKVALLTSNVLRLFSAVAPFIASIKDLCLKSQPSQHVADLPAEWRDIYAPDLHNNLFSLLLHVLGSSKQATVNSNHIAVIRALIEGTRHLQWDSLSGAHRARYPLRSVVEACTGALQQPGHTAFKYLAYRLLLAVLKPLVLEDAETLSACSALAASEPPSPPASPAAPAPPRLTLAYYHAPLCHLQHIVDAALAHVRVCEEVCSMEAFTDAHSLTLGYLLLADAVNQQCALGRGDLKHHYIHFYRERKYTEGVLCAALRLLPAGVLRQARAPPGPAPPPARRGDAYSPLFTAEPGTDVYARCGAGAVRRAACRCVFRAVRGAGCGCARGWRGAARHTHAAALDYITGKYITPYVVKEELTLLQKRMSELEDTEVTINWAAQEVRCVLTVDDKSIALTLTLARQHPLALPEVHVSHAALPNGNWLRMYLSYQNGSVLNALKMWVASVNKEMDRAPKCYICYCRLHHASAHLPSVGCRTCGNKYHALCLRTWFNTSNKRSCPLCRNNF